MKIYTKTGDKGMTSLLGGTRVPKHHIRIESYGTVDELNSFIGQLRDFTLDGEFDKMLLMIQRQLFTIGSRLAADPTKANIKIPEISQENISLLETEIDRMNEHLPEMRYFILPGGHPAVSACHIARCVCRRAERNIVHLSELEMVDPLILEYMNRLSDYLFVLARMIGHSKGSVETPWKSGD
jgi:cob(I)alamin adenosyltransferase